jgi:hypothetical protein
MNSDLNPTLITRVTSLALLLACAGSIAGAAPVSAPAASPSEPPVTKSVFVDRPNFGRDPFFPNSSRRGKLVEATVAQPVASFDNIALKGISGGTADKRLAILNNKTFEAGEEGELRVAGQLTRVKVVEIREKSVVISINGITKELFLGTRF